MTPVLSLQSRVDWRGVHSPATTAAPSIQSPATASPFSGNNSTGASETYTAYDSNGGMPETSFTQDLYSPMSYGPQNSSQTHAYGGLTLPSAWDLTQNSAFAQLNPSTITDTPSFVPYIPSLPGGVPFIDPTLGVNPMPYVGPTSWAAPPPTLEYYQNSSLPSGSETECQQPCVAPGSQVSEEQTELDIIDEALDMLDRRKAEILSSQGDPKTKVEVVADLEQRQANLMEARKELSTSPAA